MKWTVCTFWKKIVEQLIPPNYVSLERSSGPEEFCKKIFPRNFEKFTGKHLCQSLLFNKVWGIRPAMLLKKKLWHSCFPVNYAKFVRSTFHRTPPELLLSGNELQNPLKLLFQNSIIEIKKMRKRSKLVTESEYSLIRSSRPEVFFKKSVLRNFKKATGKHLWQSLFFKKETLAQLFSCKCCEISKSTFFQRTPLVAAFV